MPNPYEGDPRFGERRFVDSPGIAPPWYDTENDPHWMRTPTYADETIAEAESDARAPVSVAGLEPRESEMSWGRGLMAPISRGHEPTQIEILKAQQRTNPADPGASHLDRFADWIREP